MVEVLVRREAGQDFEFPLFRMLFYVHDKRVRLDQICQRFPAWVRS